MKKFLIFVITGLLVFGSCASTNVVYLSGVIADKEFEVDLSYASLKVSNAVQVIYSEDATVLTLSADSAVLPYLQVKEKGGELKIFMDCPYSVFKGGNIGEIKAVVPASHSLTRLELSGASSLRGGKLDVREFTLSLSGASFLDLDLNTASKIDMTVTGASKCHSSIVANSVAINASGASRIYSSVNAESLAMEVSGASDADVSGKVGKYSLEASGAANVSSGREIVETETFVCGISGASKAVVRCNVSANGDVSGASSIKIYGNASVDISSSGASSVIRK